MKTNTITTSELFVKHSKEVFSFLNYKVGNKETAEDLTSEVFIRVHRFIDTYNSELSAPKTWVFNITKNVLFDYFKSKKQTYSLNRLMDRTEEGFAGYEPAATTKTDALVLSNELLDTIKEGLAYLKPMEQEVITLFHLEGYNLNEITEMLNIPLSTVKTHLSRGRVELRNVLSITLAR